ncbi:hypothetical protein [Xylophilus ampelinus]|uniref:Uncharacterized protein n=1 Tax=Xylophilus ampelinus TaxID=54067 RepID=A0A318SKG5_9BURK|nr:hypothetical protein [Xylophilus ampelinus]MCS4508948.1 hypothetical protein [Xylophilus ampelinus]PYE79514.1 hypothetical protein DFQ15_102249 [Xylophilus ampelinus]
MYLVVIAWLYVTLTMAAAEATASNGSLLGALVTFVLYGLLPMGIVVYLMGSPARRRAIKGEEAEELENAAPPPAPAPAPDDVKEP